MDDEPGFLQLLVEALSPEGHLVEEAQDGLEAWAMVQSQTYDLLIINLMMPNMDGERFYRLIADAGSKLAKKCVFLTGATFSSEFQEFLASNHSLTLYKPVSLQEIQKLVVNL